MPQKCVMFDWLGQPVGEIIRLINLHIPSFTNFSIVSQDIDAATFHHTNDLHQLNLGEALHVP